MNLMRLVKPNVDRNKRYFKYLERSDCDEKYVANVVHKYKLKGILNPSFNYLDLYRTHFGSAYQKDQKTLSQFFKVFVEYVFLREMVGRIGSEREKQKLTAKQLIEQNKQVSIKDMCQTTQKLIEQTNKRFNKFYSDHKELLTSSEKISPSDQTALIRSTIDQLLNNFYNKIPQIFNQTPQTETFPIFIKNQQELLWFVRGQFEKIQNIHILSPGGKKKQLGKVQQNVKMYMQFRYEEEQIPQDCQRQTQQAQNFYAVYVERLSPESSPVLTTLQNYIGFRKQERSLKIANPDINTVLNKCSVQLVKQLFRQCCLFYKFTKTYYPLIDSTSILFNQKSLRPVLSQLPLIYDGVGVSRRNNGSLQVNLAVNPTPSNFQFEKSIWQYNQKNMWMLLDKYYGKDYQPELRKELEQKVHAWRLLCIFYRIMNDGQHLTYNYYNNQLIKGAEQSPFDEDLYKNMLSTLEGKLRDEPKSIKQYLSWPEIDWSLYSSLSEPPKQKQEPSAFDFKIQQLQAILSLSTEDDTLLEQKRFTLIEQEIWSHSIICSEIWTLTHTNTYFNRAPNALKYTIVYATVSMQIAYQSYLFLNKSEHFFLLRGQILRELKEYHNYMFNKERSRKRNYHDNCREKLQDYLKKTQDPSKDFLTKDNPSFSAKIEEIDRLKIKKENIELELDKLQVNLQLESDPEQKRLIKGDLIKYREDLRKAVVKLYNIAAQMLEQVFKQWFPVDRLADINGYHKDIKSKAYAAYITKKLHYLLRTYLTINSENWIKYESFIFPALLTPKNMGRTESKKIEDRSDRQIEEYIKEELNSLEYTIDNRTHKL